MTAFSILGPVPSVVILDIFNRESILVFPTQKLLGAGAPLTRLFNNSVQGVSGDAGFRPGSRGPFAETKGLDCYRDRKNAEKLG